MERKGLIGLYTNKFRRDGKFECLGRIIDKAEDGYYIVIWFSWRKGSEPSHCTAVHTDVIETWKLHSDHGSLNKWMDWYNNPCGEETE